MTMLAMWLDENSVALATDSKMSGEATEVPKLHRLNHNVMFGIGFGPGAFEWLCIAPCKKHPYPEHWRDCSQANNTNDLEKIIKEDLHTGGFPQESHLELWIAGINDQGGLEAFILNGAGHRVKQLTPGNVVFNNTIIECVSAQNELILSKFGVHPSIPEQKFYALKIEMDENLVKFSGTKALEEVCKQLIKICEDNDNPYIAGSLQYQAIFL